MKTWRYIYLLIWLIVATCFFSGLWLAFAESLPQLPDGVWYWSARILGKSEDLASLVGFVYAFIIVTVITIPVAILWNRRFPIQQLSSLPCHPAERIVRIVLISFAVFVWLGAIIGDTYFPLPENHRANFSDGLPILLIASAAAIICGNYHRKMSLKPAQ
ncbi:hypothetical protein [Collimonas antrihumi]|uniref:hypothetical protein n=1 Tax=Collimonas antrihumi TaxID=1940615 RepID=UPI001B8D4BE0|nr:hypothetical protein [Collimonas antrihumi]